MVDFGLHFSCSSLAGGGWPDLYDEAISQTLLAEQLGFTYSVVAEHHFTKDGWIPSPIVLCGALAGATERIRVGTDIIVTPLHHPIEIAENMLVLDNLSRGRAVCGLGLGASERDFKAFDIPFRQRVSRTEETLSILRDLMRGVPVTYEGRYFTLEDLTVTPGPVQQPRPRMMYGAQSEPGARRAARFADHMVIAPHVAISKLPAIRAAYEQELEAQGITERPELILRREAFVAEDAKEARDLGARALHQQYSRVYSHIPLDATQAEIDDYLATRFVIGAPEEAVTQLQRFVEAADCDTVIFRIQTPQLPAQAVSAAVEILGKTVLPWIREAVGRQAS